MSDTVMDINALPHLLLQLFSTSRVVVSEANGIVQVTPIKEEIDCTIGLRGMFAGDPNMTIDKFLERKRADKELDL